MAFTTPGTAVAGDVLTAAFYNVNVRDNVNALYPGHLIVTTTERNALTGVTTGFEVFNSTTGALEMYNGTSFQMNRPFALATGRFTLPAGTTGTITFPANRFTVAPVVTIGLATIGAALAFIIIGSVTTSQFSYEIDTSAAGGVVHYHAIQMTATSGTG